MASTKYSTEVYAEPIEEFEVLGTPTKIREKQNNRFSVDFETLERVLAHEDDEDEGRTDVDAQAYNDLRRQDSYRFTTRSANHANPQKIILYSPSFDSTFHATSFQDLDIHHKDLPGIFSEDAEHLWWMDVQNPSEKELRLLCSAFGIHPLTIEDILNREVQEKIEDFTRYYFACFRSFRVEASTQDKTCKPYTIYMVVFPAGTLSFCFSDSEHADHVLKRIELLKDYLSINSDLIFYAFVDDIVDSFNPSINQIEKIVNKIEDQVYTAREDDKQAFIKEIEQVRKSTSALLRLLSPKNHVLSGFEKHRCGEEHDEEPSDEKSNPGHDLRLYIHDVRDHVTTMLGNLHQFESLLARSQNNYLAGLSIDNMQGRQRVNSFINIMAVISMILTLMNIICALFGTNVNASVPIYVDDTPAWYIIVGGEVALSLVLFSIARRLKWC